MSSPIEILSSLQFQVVPIVIISFTNSTSHRHRHFQLFNFKSRHRHQFIHPFHHQFYITSSSSTIQLQFVSSVTMSSPILHLIVIVFNHSNSRRPIVINGFTNFTSHHHRLRPFNFKSSYCHRLQPFR